MGGQIPEVKLLLPPPRAVEGGPNGGVPALPRHGGPGQRHQQEDDVGVDRAQLQQHNGAGAGDPEGERVDVELRVPVQAQHQHQLEDEAEGQQDGGGEVVQQYTLQPPRPASSRVTGNI